MLSDRGVDFFGWSYVELGIRLSDPCGFLAAHDIICKCPSDSEVIEECQKYLA